MSEPLPGSAPSPLTAAESAELARRRRSRNWVLLLLLLGLALLFYAISMVKMGVH